MFRDNGQQIDDNKAHLSNRSGELKMKFLVFVFHFFVKVGANNLSHLKLMGPRPLNVRNGPN